LTITICITTFNRWESCFCTLQSVCNQEQVSGVEVILVDDCSTEPMPESIDRFIQNNQIVFIRHENNKGLSAARNTAIKQASGEYFSFCDDDDIWPTDLACRLLNSIREVGPLGMAIAISEKMRIAWELQLGVNPKLTDVILEGVTPPVGSQLYKTSMIRDVGGYNERVTSGVDHDLWISLAMVDPMVAVSWGQSAMVGSDPSADRMTTIEGRRRGKIASSLEIWKPKIIQVFDENFYHHFCFSYAQYLDYSFFTNSVHRGEYLKAGVKLFDRYIVLNVMMRIYKKIIGRQHINLFPTYRKKRN